MCKGMAAHLSTSSCRIEDKNRKKHDKEKMSKKKAL
jgi:hypothetical protein